MQPLPMKKRRVYFYTLSVIFFIGIPFILLYTSGYRITSDFNLVETGGIYIYSPEAGSQIYINHKKEKETGIFQKDLFIQNLTPGVYSILISKKGFWPWSKEVEIEERKVAEAIAFLIPQSPESKRILKDIEIPATDSAATSTTPNKEYEELSLLFETPEQPATSTVKFFEKFSDRGRVGIWRDQYNNIFAEWLKDKEDLPNYFCRRSVCESTVLVFNSTGPIKSFDFYPKREDVVLMALSNGVFAIEIDVRKNQNFQPIYKGVDPYFIINNSVLYIKDNEDILEISL